MSQFETEFAATVVPELFELFGQTGDYYAPGATSVTTAGLTLIVQEADAGVEFAGADELYERVATVKVATDTLATAAVDGRFVIGSDTWVIINPPRSRNGLWYCDCRWVDRGGIGTQRRGE